MPAASRRSGARSRTPRRAASRGRSASSSPKDHLPLNPRTKKYEWGGPLGAFGMVLLLPSIVIVLNAICSEKECSIGTVYALPSLLQETLLASAPHIPLALGIELAWMVLHALLYIAPIGKRVKGTKLRNGETLVYNLNALHAFVLSHAVLGILHYHGTINLASLADMFTPLMFASIIISSIMSVVLYLVSFRNSEALLSPGGNTGSCIYDFWVGRELNPRSGQLDWKFMCELRPGLIGWSVLNWAFVAKAVETGTCQPNIVIVAVLEFLYVFDGLLLEAGNLTMMDIVHDGFGFMLCFGDLTWVPFTYTLKTKFLASHPVDIGNMYMVVCCLLAVLGYIIFRGSNIQKSRFRENPLDRRVTHLKVMKTSQGKSLIISGFWGVCRHPNYVGDWLMTLSWSALTGTVAILPYYQPIYFAFLLIHRQLRDEQQMANKYGDSDWKKFCGTVRYRLIPFVY